MKIYKKKGTTVRIYKFWIENHNRTAKKIQNKGGTTKWVLIFHTLEKKVMNKAVMKQEYQIATKMRNKAAEVSPKNLHV